MRWAGPVFMVCVAGVVAALGWVSVTALRLDRAEAEARQQAAVEEASRLALWRMDFFVAALLAQENARPYFHYSSHYPSNRAYGNMFEGDAASGELIESPLLNERPQFVALYFQVEPDGRVSSPSVPDEALANLADDGKGAGTVDRSASAARLAALAGVGRLREQLPPLATPVRQQQARFVVPLPQVAQFGSDSGGDAGNAQPGAADAQREAAAAAQRGDEPRQYAAKGQQARSQSELEARQRGVQQTSEQVLSNTLQPGAAAADVVHGPLVPAWLGSQLVLARRVQVKEAQYVQGIVLDWEALRVALLAEVSDLLPAARLDPVEEARPDGRHRLLAALPVRLTPGAVAPAGEGGLTPIRAALLLTWACGLLATVAVGLLLHGATALAERRAAFVSSVTHELRTPLTTFRLYSDLLAGGMVADEAKRAEYLRTLQTEAQRLTHLVENVLAYARLERGRGPRSSDPILVSELVARACERLPERAAQAKMTLQIEVDPSVAECSVRADPSAVEQVLFNLVDNACKYAARGEPRILIRAAPGAKASVELRVRDFGPGLRDGVRSEVFRPFRRSAAEAAGNAPGVGLGLSLSRRIARGMGGDLWIDARERPGACFVLRIPASGRTEPGRGG